MDANSKLLTYITLEAFVITDVFFTAANHCPVKNISNKSYTNIKGVHDSITKLPSIHSIFLIVPTEVV